MKKVNKFSVLALSLLLATTLAGCELGGNKSNDAEVKVVDSSNAKVVSAEDTTKLLREGFINLGEMKSMSYSLDTNGDFTSSANEKVSFNVKLSGDSDSKDKTKPKFTLAFDGSLSGMVEGAEQNLAAKAELRINEAFLYATISEITGLENNPNVPKEMIDAYVGKWWKIALPQDAFSNLNDIIPEGDEADMTDTEKAMKSLIENTEFFSEAKLASSKGDTDVYALTLDTEAFKAFIIDGAKIDAKDAGYEMTEDDIAKLKTDLDEQFKNLKIKDLQVSYNTKFKVVSGVAVSFAITSPNGETVDLNKLSIGLSNFNEPVTIVEPKDATLFDPTTIMGGGDTQYNTDVSMNNDTEGNIDFTDTDTDTAQ